MTYNGHKNRNYWNVALWIGNDYGLYTLAINLLRTSRTKDEAARTFVDRMKDSGKSKTPDGAPYSYSAVRAALRGLEVRGENTMTIAERNRAIKKTLETAFGRGKVRVRGSRGTAYGWVSVNIDWTPLDADQASEMRSKVWQLLLAAGPGKEIGTYGYDDPGSDYGYGNKINISFNPPRYYRTQKMSNGQLAVLRDSYNGTEWETIEP